MSKQNRPRILTEERCFLRFMFALVLMIVGLGLNLNLSNAQSPKTSNVPERIVIAHSSHMLSAPVYVAVENGYFKPGLDVSLHPFPAGIAALNEILEGRAEIATVSETPFMYAVLNRSEVSVVATISEIRNP